MTREEAFSLIYPWGIATQITKSEVDRFLDWSVALGMLKLDEPKNVLGQAIAALNVAVSTPYCSTLGILKALEEAGLRIVEK